MYYMYLYSVVVIFVIIIYFLFLFWVFVEIVGCVQGCISCVTCSYPELTEDHVLTSAYVKIFRNVTRNAVNKSV